MVSFYLLNNLSFDNKSTLKTEYGTTSVIMAEAEIQSERVDDIALLIKQQ